MQPWKTGCGVSRFTTQSRIGCARTAALPSSSIALTPAADPEVSRRSVAVIGDGDGDGDGKVTDSKDWVESSEAEHEESVTIAIAKRIDAGDVQRRAIHSPLCCHRREIFDFELINILR
jgi:hypothetical protein